MPLPTHTIIVALGVLLAVLASSGNDNETAPEQPSAVVLELGADGAAEALNPIDARLTLERPDALDYETISVENLNQPPSLRQALLAPAVILPGG